MDSSATPERRASLAVGYNPVPQNAPGAGAAVGHTIENSIPLSIFPISMNKVCICFCGLVSEFKTKSLCSTTPLKIVTIDYSECSPVEGKLILLADSVDTYPFSMPFQSASSTFRNIVES